MKFRAKMTLWMVALLSLLFGAGGSLLISGSFQASLEREKDAAFSAHRMVWSALQIVGGLEAYLDGEAITDTMAQLWAQNRSAWAALRLTGPEGVLYASDAVSAYPFGGAAPAAGQCAFSIGARQDGAQCLVLCGAAGTLRLETAHDISDLYAVRQAQQRTWLRVFFVMEALCAALSYTVSRVLTSQLVRLSRASRAIASGRFSSRVRVRSEDEIGAVSEDFNAMAAQMEAAIAELRGAVERQERFVGSFAHEMKTPMTSLIGYAELLRSGALTPEEQADAVGYVYSEGKRLEKLSRKLLELLVLRRQDLPLLEVSPSALIENLMERLQPLYAAKGVSLSCQCEPGLCLLEPELVWSLLLNLTDNARKAIRNGGRIHYRLEMLPDGCRITVEDSGAGIPPEALAHLTEAFYRADKARSRAQGGFGLGLALCQEVAALHHGSMAFANRPGGGARVTAELHGGRLS